MRVWDARSTPRLNTCLQDDVPQAIIYTKLVRSETGFKASIGLSRAASGSTFYDICTGQFANIRSHHCSYRPARYDTIHWIICELVLVKGEIKSSSGEYACKELQWGICRCGYFPHLGFIPTHITGCEPRFAAWQSQA